MNVVVNLCSAYAIFIYKKEDDFCEKIYFGPLEEIVVVTNYLYYSYVISDRNKFNYIIHKYGIYFHTMLLLYLLYRVECYPNTGIYWAFLINLLVYSYFVFLNGEWA